MAKVNWRQIADGLAERLMYHAACSRHAEDDPECPFCNDRAAYREYLDAGGNVKPEVFKDATTIRIEDVK